MKLQQIKITKEINDLPNVNFDPNLILTFGKRATLETTNMVKKITKTYPDAIVMGCSTAGQMMGEEVLDDESVVTLVQFEKTQLAYAEVALNQFGGDSKKAGKALASEFKSDELKHIFVLSDGLNVNGTALAEGMMSALASDVAITGGLAADGADFTKTVVIANGEVKTEVVTAVGFYGDQLKVNYGSKGGWDSFGIDRKVTKSKENVLFELDGEPALDLYKSFLGEKAKELPASGLLFPLSMRFKEGVKPVVRTILGINEDDKSLTFAGDIPEGSFVRLMKANRDRLINGAEDAAEAIMDQSDASPNLAILVSCVGRKLVLKQIVEEEVEAVKDSLGHPTVTGFYSYGELAPFEQDTACALHNQTMTITTLTEEE